MMMGRKRKAAASRADSSALPLCFLNCSALVISNTALAIDTPTDMMIPMYDCRFRVEPVSVKSNKEPKITAGTVAKITRGTLNDWKLAASIKNITTIATNSPDCKLSSVSVSTLLMPMAATFKPLGSSPTSLIAFSTSLVAVPKSVW
ncbi:hypothetical protein D3C73_1087250 [compost metagenome]